MERSAQVSTYPTSTGLHIGLDPDLIVRASNANPAFGRILDEQVGPLLELMAEKSLDYGNGAESLGLAGQFSDMNRKWTKLRRAMWDDIELAGPEKLPEVLQDMIGHCLLSLDMLAHEGACEVDTNVDELRGALSQLVDVVSSYGPTPYPGLLAEAINIANEVLAK